MLEMHALTKRFGQTLAVDDLTVAVRPGTVTGLLGPNGSGKSTALRLAVGLDTPTSGRVTFDGRPYAAHRAPMRTIGCLLDADAVEGSRTPRRHLDWIARSQRLDAGRVDAVLDAVGLHTVGDRPIRGFSLGMRQRLGIATSLLGDPGTLLLDEPMNGLDPAGIHWIRGLLRGLAGEGRTVLVSSHLIAEMAATADRLVVIGQGRLLADTTVDALAGRDGSVAGDGSRAGDASRAAAVEAAYLRLSEPLATYQPRPIQPASTRVPR